jgi:hypothetical protein
MEPIKFWQNKKDMETLYRFLGCLENLDLMFMQLPRVIDIREWCDFMESI